MDQNMTVFLVVGGVVLLLLLWVAVMYNSLVQLRNHVKESWVGIDIELKRRYDLIPNLVNAVKGYATHEKDVLERVMQSRQAALAPHNSLRDQARDENAMIAGLRQVFAVAEAYPDLKASTNFLHLQEELINTEDRIQRARRFYNANVRDLNTRIELFPSNIIAGMFGFKQHEPYEIEDASMRQAPEVKV